MESTEPQNMPNGAESRTHAERSDAAVPSEGGEGRATEVHHDVTGAGVRMRVTEWTTPTRDGERYPVVALPGVLAPRTSFRALAQHLHERFRLIAVDFPGFGESEKPSVNRYPYGIPAFADAIADLFGGLGLSRAHVVGHGLGGAVALQLSTRHPELVARLGLIAPLAQPSPRSQLYRALVAPLVGGLVFRQIVGRSAFRSFYLARVNPDATPDQLDEYYESVESPASRAALLATLRACVDTRAVIASSRRVRAPTLLLWGRDDALFPLSLGRRLSREMPSAGLELLPTGHAPHEQAPKRVAEILESFFSGRRAGIG